MQALALSGFAHRPADPAPDPQTATDLALGGWTHHDLCLSRDLGGHGGAEGQLAECRAYGLGKEVALARAASGPVAPLVLRWIGPDGAITDLTAEAQGDSLIMTPPAGIKPGTQFGSWRVVSADGHGVGGTHSFRIGTATDLAEATEATASGAARAILTLALAIALGAVLAQGPQDRGRRMALALSAWAVGRALSRCRVMA